MYQILRIFGVKPEALARLHKVLEGDDVKTEKEIGVRIGDNITRKKIPCAELLSSKLEGQGKTYRVEIKVWMAMPCLHPELSGNWKDQKIVGATIFPSFKLLLAIYKALDVYPEEEKLIASSVIV